MKHYKKQLIFCLFVLGSFMACNEVDKGTQEFLGITQNINFKGNSIQLENDKDNVVSFEFYINKNFPLSSKNHLDSILQLARKHKVDTPVAAWLYVVNTTFHSNPISQGQWLHSPSIFSNSLASGYCDDLAAFLVSLWEEIGYEARVVSLEGHVVAEVFYQGKWQLFDPDKRVYFLNRNKEISSLNEMETDSFSISHPSTLFPSIFSFNNPICQNYKNYYLSSENNKDNSEWALNNQQLNSLYTLPSFSVFNLYYDSIEGLNLACISLSSNSKGQLNIPLAPFCVEGEIQYKSEDGIAKLNEKTLPDFLNSYSQIEIVAASTDAKISYLINPYLEIFELNNTIEFSATSNLKLGSKKPMPQICTDYLDLWKFERKIDALYEKELAPYFHTISNNNLKPQNLEAEFKFYSNYNPNNLSFSAVLDFKKEIKNNFSLDEVVFNQFLTAYYPQFSFLFFTCLVEDEKAYFIHKMKEVYDD